MLTNVMGDVKDVLVMIVVDVTIKGTILVLVSIIILEPGFAWILPMYAIKYSE